MQLKELKDRIGSRARKLILSELKLEGNQDYPCCITDHRKGDKARMKWFDDGDTVQYSFYCNDCKEHYDIISHAKKHHPSNTMNYLTKLAGGAGAEPVVSKKPAKKAKVIQDFQKLKEIKFLSSELEDDAMEWLESRSISRQTAEAYGVTGNEDGCHFNYYVPVEDDDPHIVFIKARRLGDVKNGDDKYFCQAGGTPVLYGMHTYSDQPILIITEGEVDCLSLYEGIDYVDATEKVVCCSVPTGTSHVWVESCKSFIEKFQMVVVVSDADEAGVKFREVCFQKISYCKDVRWIDMKDVLPSGKKFNDVNDYLRLSGKQKVGQLLSRIEKPYHGCGMSGSKINRENVKGYIKTGFFGLDRALSGLRLGDLSMFIGDSNDGKSTLGRQMIGFMTQNEVGVGAMMGEERNDKFMDLMIRQQYHEKGLYERKEDEWGDKVWTPSAEVEERWKNEFGKHISLFQMGRVRENEPMLDKICEWIAHCADVEGRQFFFIDNLMKITSDVESDEWAEQGRVIEKLYRLVDKKNIHIMLVAHTKKIDGLMNANSVSGSKKLINTPDVVLAFQRLDRYANSKDMPKSKAQHMIAYNAGLIERPTADDLKEDYTGPEYTSYINAFKIRDKKSTYTKSVHCLKYDLHTQLSYEQLPASTTDKTKVYEDGYSVVLPLKPQI